MKKAEQERWNKVLRTHWWARGHHAIIKGLIERVLGSRREKRVKSLDVGCSGGLITNFLGRFGKAYGFDVSFDGLAQSSFREGNVVQADAVNIPFKNEEFDAVTLLDVVEHVDDERALLAEVFRVCRDQADIFVVLPAYQFLWGSHDVWNAHKRRYTKKDIMRLAKSAGFIVKRVTYLHPHLFLPLMAIRSRDRLFGRLNSGKDDFMSLGRFVDSALYGSLMIERWFLRNFNFPVGTSVFCYMRKS